MSERVYLWEIPSGDFDDWRMISGDSECVVYDDYVRLLESTEAAQESAGLEVVRVRFSVRDMQRELEKRGLPNTPENRATITAQRGESL